MCYKDRFKKHPWNKGTSPFFLFLTFIPDAQNADVMAGALSATLRNEETLRMEGTFCFQNRKIGPGFSGECVSPPHQSWPTRWWTSFMPVSVPVADTVMRSEFMLSVLGPRAWALGLLPTQPSSLYCKSSQSQTFRIAWSWFPHSLHACWHGRSNGTTCLDWLMSKWSLSRSAETTNPTHARTIWESLGRGLQFHMSSHYKNSSLWAFFLGCPPRPNDR